MCLEKFLMTRKSMIACQTPAIGSSSSPHCPTHLLCPFAHSLSPLIPPTLWITNLTNYIRIKTNYTADHMVLRFVSAGGIVNHSDHQELVKLAGKDFSSLPVSPNSIPLGHLAHPCTDFFGSEVQIYDDELACAHVAMALTNVEVEHAESQLKAGLLLSLDGTTGHENRQCCYSRRNQAHCSEIPLGQGCTHLLSCTFLCCMDIDGFYILGQMNCDHSSWIHQGSP
jgi:hypothetical protein